MKYICVSYERITILENGNVQMDVRTGDEFINVGEYIGGAKLLTVNAYGHNLDRLEPGLTARITLHQMPSFIVRADENPIITRYLEWCENEKT